MSKEPVEYLKHIRDESLYILSVTSKGITKEEFLNNETLKRAVVRLQYQRHKRSKPTSCFFLCHSETPVELKSNIKNSSIWLQLHSFSGGGHSRSH